MGERSKVGAERTGGHHAADSSPSRRPPGFEQERKLEATQHELQNRKENPMTKKSTIPAVGYIRMSSDHQQDSLKRQRQDIEALAERDGYKIVHSPTPVPFLSVTGRFRIAVSWAGPETSAAGKWIDLAISLLTAVLADWGVGGKTSSGYGRRVDRHAPIVGQVDQDSSVGGHDFHDNCHGTAPQILKGLQVATSDNRYVGTDGRFRP